jgi:glycosyltransferase involved in cell wall biosynthesis
MHNSQNSVFQVIHLSTGFNGGAANAARRLNSALNASGVKSSFGAISQKKFMPEDNEFSIPRKIHQKILSGFLARIQSRMSKKVFFSLASINILSLNFIHSKGDPQNTILHFHNWFNLTSQKKIIEFAEQGYRVVLTMHDQRMFTGGCHYAFTCTNFERDCAKCPELPVLLNRIPRINLQRFLSQIQQKELDIKFISPSRWLNTEAKKSRLLKKQDTFFISNTLGISTELEHALHVMRDDKNLRIGIASMDPNSYIKGGDLVSKLEELSIQKGLPFHFHYMSKFDKNPQGISKFWSSIDCLLVLSRADNSPNVIHEAKQLGLPVIGSNVGGIPELLDTNFDFCIPIEPYSEEYLLDSLMSLIHRKQTQQVQAEMRRNFVNYSEKSVVSHIELYESMFSQTSKI